MPSTPRSNSNNKATNNRIVAGGKQQNNDPASPLSPSSPSGRINYVKDPEALMNSSALLKNSTANAVYLPPIPKNKIPSPPRNPNHHGSPKGTSTPQTSANNNNDHRSRPLISNIHTDDASSSDANLYSGNETPNDSTINSQRSPTTTKKINYSKKIAAIKPLIYESREYHKAIEWLDEAIGSPTYADLPMFDENHPDRPIYEVKVLFELLSMRIECWMALSQYGRVLDDITNAMRVDLPSTLLRADFVVPKLKSMYELGDIQIGLQVVSSLEIAVARNGSLLEEVTEWKRKFVLANRKKNEVVDSNHHGIVIGGRRFAAGAPLCRHGCPDKEPPSFFQMDIVMHQMQCQDTFLAMYKLYTEFEGAKLSWKYWARQELRKAIDAAANENWKQCRDATRQYLLAQEFSKNGEAFVDSMDTLNRIPNPVQVDTTGRFFKHYDRAMSTIDDLVELLCEISKPFCSCMNELADLRSRRIKTTKTTDGAAASSPNATDSGAVKTRKGVTLSLDDQNSNEHTTAVVPTVPAPSVSAQLMKIKANIREAANLREEGNLLFLGRKFRSALKCYDEAIELDPSNAELSFNRTAALYELGEYDAVIAACDKTMDLVAEASTTDRPFIAKVLGRRADALWKMGALDEALWNYQESLDSLDSAAIRSKMVDCSIELGKKKLAIAHSQQQDDNNTTTAKNTADQFIENIINPKPLVKPPVPFASCVIVEPVSFSNINKKAGSVSITVFPTQVATASHFFSEAIPIPLMKFANFPFALVPCKIHENTNQQKNNTNNNCERSVTNASTLFDENASGENFFASLATKSLVSDLTDQPMSAAHHRADIWQNCGSVLVLRKDFQPVSCGQVVQLFEFLAELWGYAVPNDDEHQKMAKKQRLEIFSHVSLCRKKIAEKLGAMVDEDGTRIQFDPKKNEFEASTSVPPSSSLAQQTNNNTNNLFAAAPNSAASSSTPPTEANTSNELSVVSNSTANNDNELLAGTHVINTYSRKDELIRHNKDRDQQQVKLLKEQGNKLYKGRRFRTALLRYDEGLMLDATNPELLYNRAAALLELSMFELAVDSCSRALDSATALRSDDKNLISKIKARRNLAYRKLGKFDEIEMVKNPDKSLTMLKGVTEVDDDEEDDLQNEGDE